MLASEDTGTDLAIARLRIAQLEHDAVDRGHDTERALKDQLDHYPSLGLAIAQLIWIGDPDGGMADDQPNWSAYTGQTSAQYRHEGWLGTVHPDDREAFKGAWKAAVFARAPFEVELRLRRRDGQYRYFSFGAMPTLAGDGSVREWVGIHTDITEQKLTAQLLKDGERRFRELADAMPQIVWQATPDGRHDYFNQRWYDFTGRPDGTMSDASWDDAIHPDDQANSRARWNLALQSGEPYEIEHRLRSKDGAYRWHLARALPVRDEHRTITRWFGTCTDIDGRRVIEDRLQALTVSLTRSNRELEEFASVASHDLQEPLRKIHSFVGCLRDEQGAVLNDEGRDYLDRIQRAAVRMRTLIDDLLNLSRVSSQSAPFVPVKLNDVAAGVVSDLESRLAETGGRVEVLSLPMVTGDPTQMRQLLQNLIGNALKFHRPGVVPLVRVSAETVDAICRISVADNGIGFDEKYLDRIFTIFQRLHGRDEYEGTGIGLAICRKIAERHGGAITARSKAGEGSTFVVTLPVQLRSGDLTNASSAGTASPPLSRAPLISLPRN